MKFLDRVRQSKGKRVEAEDCTGYCQTCGNLATDVLGCEAHDKLILLEYPPYTAIRRGCPDWIPSERRIAMPRYIDAEQMEKHIMESKVFNQYFKELVQGLIWGENTIDAVPVVRGEWEVAIGYDPNKKVQCQSCYKMAYEPTAYCPICGKRLEEHHEAD